MVKNVSNKRTTHIDIYFPGRLFELTVFWREGCRSLIPWSKLSEV
jgi:hypothetical protein